MSTADNKKAKHNYRDFSKENETGSVTKKPFDKLRFNRRFFMALLSALIFMGVNCFCAEERWISNDEWFSSLDKTKAVYVSSEKQVQKVIKKAINEKTELLTIKVDPKVYDPCVVKTGKSHGATYVDVSVKEAIENYTDYGCNGGLYSAVGYDLFAGPCVEHSIIQQDYADYNLPAEKYNYYEFRFDFHDNSEELAKADAKLKKILKAAGNVSDAGKIRYLISWMKKHVPKEKESNDGYERNCNGIYGCLFGDGTGYACHTYASTIQRYLELAGIKGYILSGAYELGDMNHAFNVMRLNGKWYATDYGFGMTLVGKNSVGYGEYELITKYMKKYPFASSDYTEPAGAKVPVKSGTVLTDTGSKGKYRVLSGSMKVAYIGPLSKNTTAVSVPAVISVNGRTYKVTAIGAKACTTCKKLKKVTIGKNVSEIGKEAFKGCEKLKTVTIKTTVLKKVGKNAFKGIHAKAKIKVPAKVKQKYRKLGIT